MDDRALPAFDPRRPQRVYLDQDQPHRAGVLDRRLEQRADRRLHSPRPAVRLPVGLLDPADRPCRDLVVRREEKGITISTFSSVPDAPISTFDLVLPEGPHSALAGYGNLCKSKLNMPTAITGQNGAVIKQKTRIAVAGCPKHKKARRAETHRHRRRAKEIARLHA
jgi:hypothetical protein